MLHPRSLSDRGFVGFNAASFVFESRIKYISLAFEYYLGRMGFAGIIVR
jgi:hypothetical protein